MLIAVPTDSKSEKDPISGVFGRSKYLAIFDSEEKKIEFVENPGAKQARGSGMATAQFLIEKGVGKVITANLGPNAENALKSAGIEAEVTERAPLKEIIEN